MYTVVFQEVWGCVDARVSVLCLLQLISTLHTEQAYSESLATLTTQLIPETPVST